MEKAVKTFLDSSLNHDGDIYLLHENHREGETALYEDLTFATGGGDWIPVLGIWRVEDKYKVTLEFIGNEGPSGGRVRSITCSTWKEVLKALVQIKESTNNTVVRMLKQLYPERDCKFLMEHSDDLIEEISRDPEKCDEMSDVIIWPDKEYHCKCR